MSDSLRWLTKNEQPWGNRSGRSPKMSECQIACFFQQIAHSLIFSQKTSDLLRKPMSEFPALIFSLSQYSNYLLYPPVSLNLATFFTALLRGETIINNSFSNDNFLLGYQLTK